MRKLTILLDLDDTLNNQGELWVEELSTTYRYNVKYEDITSWDISQFYPGLNENETYRPALNPDMVSRMSPKRDSIWFTSEWHNRGHTIMVITATDIETVIAKTHWLKRYYPWFAPQNLIVTQKKQLVRGDILIDDGIHNLLPDEEIGTEPMYTRVCFDRPWNRKFDCEAHGIQRAYNFEEIDKIIREIESSEGD